MTDSMQFFQAAAEGDVAALVALLDAGADPNWINPHAGNTALYNASISGEADAVRVLLDRGADPNLRMNYHSPVDGRREDGVVALMYARSSDVVAALVSGGADVNAKDGNGLTPLIRACHWGKFEVVKALLDAGADPSLKAANGRMASDFAAARIEGYRRMAGESNNDAVAKRIKTFQDVISLLMSRGNRDE
jgi:uncharacterized protein